MLVVRNYGRYVAYLTLSELGFAATTTLGGSQSRPSQSASSAALEVLKKADKICSLIGNIYIFP